MMDYKELIKRLRASNRDALVSSEEVADAIETLLAELDNAIDLLHHNTNCCQSCYYNYRSINDFPCTHCKETGGMTDYWKWCSPKKEENHETD